MRILTHTPHMCVCQTRSSSKCLPSFLVKANSFLVPLRSRVQKSSILKKTAPPNLSIYMYVICHIYLNNCQISILMTPHYSPGKRKTLCQKKVSNDSARQGSQLLPTNQIITSNLMSPFFLEKKTTPHTSSSMVNYIGSG